MNDWWFFIISDIVGRATLILALLAVFFVIYRRNDVFRLHK